MISIYDIKNGFGSHRGDKNLVLIPPVYGTSLCHSINTPLAFGCTTQLQPIYNPKTFAKDLLKYRPKIVVASKAHYISLLKEKYTDDEIINIIFNYGNYNKYSRKLIDEVLKSHNNEKTSEIKNKKSQKNTW